MVGGAAALPCVNNGLSTAGVGGILTVEASGAGAEYFGAVIELVLTGRIEDMPAVGAETVGAITPAG